MSEPPVRLGFKARSARKRHKRRGAEILVGTRRRRDRVRDKQPSLDQFVKKDEQKNKGIRVVVDSRETNSDVVRKLVDLGVELKIETLKTGDYVLSDRCIAERKTASDFCASIIDGRLFAQITSLKESYEKPFVLVEGETLYGLRNVLPQAIVGALATILVDHGVPVVRTESGEETALLLASIARREQLENKREPRVRVKHRPATVKEAQEFVVAGLPNVDAVRARRLLEEFETVEQVFTKSEEELTQVHGIGRKTARRIREVIGSKYVGSKGDRCDNS